MIIVALAFVSGPALMFWAFRLGYLDGFRAERPPARMPLDILLAKQLKVLGHKTYAEYLKSPHWIALRRARMQWQAVRCCAGCTFRWNLKVHHRTYVRLGHERMTDLVILCGWCHEDTHTLVGRGVKLRRGHHALRRRRRFHGMVTGPLT